MKIIRITFNNIISLSLKAISRKRLFGLFLLIAFLGFSSINAQLSRLNLSEKFHVLQVDKRVLFSAQNELYQFNAEDDAFKSLNIPSKFNENKVRRMYQYQDWVWFLLDSGIAALHIKLNDWLIFDDTKGLPANKINSVTFLDDYVWICSDNGIARFDLMIEQWETFGTNRGLPSLKVSDIVSIGKSIWILSDKTITEYDSQYEKWRSFEHNSTGKVSRLFKLGEEIWIAGDDGFIRFNTQLLTFQHFSLPYLKKERILEIYYSDDQIWVISKSGLFNYDKQSSSWKEFEGNCSLKDVSIENGFINQNQIWILTMQNIMLWDRTKKNWEFLDYSTGLSSSNYLSGYSDGNLSILFGRTILDYRRSPSEPWKKYQYQSSTAKFGSNFLKNLFDNDEGGYVQIGENKLSFFGTRINYLNDWKNTINDSSGAGTVSSKLETRIDFRGQYNFDEQRRITAYYNNVDYSETMYAARYRGKDNDSTSGDLVREINIGDFRKESGTNPFAEKANMFGGNLWLQYGDKTAKFKRSLLTLKASSGEVRTQKTFESFIGAKYDVHAQIQDLSYLRNRFFALSGVSKNDKITDLSLYIDDKDKSSNDANTLVNETIAGVTGDFNPMIPSDDFYLMQGSNSVCIIRQIIGSSTIAVRFKKNGTPAEAVLQIDTLFSSQLKNSYFLNGQKIIPFSFSLKIIDKSNKEIPLSKFGIEDAVLPGKINSDFIDYKNGYLTFPDFQPFPDEVYSKTLPKSSYYFDVSFKTEMALLQLKQTNLVRGSEVLKIDGSIATGGNDYVIDYTNGTLIFVREGILNPDTQIEIEYEYYRTEYDKLHNVSVNLSPSDNFMIQADWQSQSQDSNNLISLHSDIRQNIENSVDLKFIPGIAFQTNEKRITSGFYDFYLSTSWLRIQNSFQRFDKDYENIYMPKEIFGDISDKFSFNATADLIKEIRLTYRHNNITGDGKSIFEIDNSKNNSFNSIHNAGIIFHSGNLPSIQMNFQNDKLNFRDSSFKRAFIIGLMEYQIPKFVLSRIFLTGLKFESYLRYGTEQKFTGDESNTRFLQNYYKISSQFTDRIQGSVYYRISKLDDIDLLKPQRLQKSERLLVDFSQEQWRLLQLNLRFESNLEQYNHLQSLLKNYYLRQFAQANFRFSPGQISEIFNSLFFEFNFNQSSNLSGKDDRNISQDLWNPVFKGENLSDSYLNRNYYLKNEFRPNSKIFFTTIAEWNTQDITVEQTKSSRIFKYFTEKIDLRFGLETHLIAQYKQNYQDYGFGRNSIEYEPSLWLERRWTPDFLNILNLLFRKRNSEIMKIENDLDGLQAQLDLVYRKSKLWGIKQFEIRQSFGGQYNTETLSDRNDNYQLSSGTAIDVYPISTFIIRTRFDLLRYKYLNTAVNSFWSWTFNLKLSLQM